VLWLQGTDAAAGRSLPRRLWGRGPITVGRSTWRYHDADWCLS
jgi:hypothetical protein